jgi:hypothetical protein
VHLKTRGYRPALKYITSFADVTFGANTPLEDDLTLALARFDAV